MKQKKAREWEAELVSTGEEGLLRLMRLRPVGSDRWTGPRNVSSAMKYFLMAEQPEKGEYFMRLKACDSSLEQIDKAGNVLISARIDRHRRRVYVLRFFAIE